MMKDTSNNQMRSILYIVIHPELGTFGDLSMSDFVSCVSQNA